MTSDEIRKLSFATQTTSSLEKLLNDVGAAQWNAQVEIALQLALRNEREDRRERTMLAGMAMQGMLAAYDGVAGENGIDDIVPAAVKYADALVARLSRNK